MKDELLAVIRQEVERSVKQTVNGKIDKVQTSLNEHIDQHKKDMDELKPFIQARIGGAFVYKFLLGAGAIALAWSALKTTWPQL